MNAEPKPEPVGGEWTAEYVKQLWLVGYKEIADTHNAALGAEREKVDWLKSQLKLSNDALSPAQQEIHELRAELAMRTHEQS